MCGMGLLGFAQSKFAQSSSPNQACPIKFAQSKFAQRTSSPNPSSAKKKIFLAELLGWANLYVGRTCTLGELDWATLDWANLDWAKPSSIVWNRLGTGLL